MSVGRAFHRRGGGCWTESSFTNSKTSTRYKEFRICRRAQISLTLKWRDWRTWRLSLIVCRSTRVCLSVCQRDNSWTVWDIIVRFLWEQDKVKNSDEFENICIPMHCGRGWWFNDSDVLVAIRTVLSSVSICVCMCLYVSICVCVTVYRKATRVFTSRHWLVTLMSLKSYCSMALKSISSHRSRCHSSSVCLSVCLSVCPHVCLFTNTRGSLFCQILIDLNNFLLLQQRSNDLLVVREPCRPKCVRKVANYVGKSRRWTSCDLTDGRAMCSARMK